ncbi:Uncharacterised protein [Mycobacterium tuberculosis]|nr:Uncharacterised protein [Mycobacterium tuberculosis]
MAGHGNRTARYRTGIRAADRRVCRGVRGICRLVAGGRAAWRPRCTGTGSRGCGAARAVRGDGVTGRAVEVGRSASGCGDRSFARRDRCRLRCRRAVAARRRTGGHAAQQVAGRTGRPGRHGVHRVRCRPGAGFVGALRRSGQHRRRQRPLGGGGVGRSGRAGGADRGVLHQGTADPPDRGGLCLAFGGGRGDPWPTRRSSVRHRTAIHAYRLLLYGDRKSFGYSWFGRRLLVPRRPPDRAIRPGGAQRLRAGLPHVHRIQPASGVDYRCRGNIRRVHRR